MIYILYKIHWQYSHFKIHSNLGSRLRYKTLKDVRLELFAQEYCKISISVPVHNIHNIKYTTTSTTSTNYLINPNQIRALFLFFSRELCEIMEEMSLKRFGRVTRLVHYVLSPPSPFYGRALTNTKCRSCCESRDVDTTTGVR